MVFVYDDEEFGPKECREDGCTEELSNKVARDAHEAKEHRGVQNQ